MSENKKPVKVFKKIKHKRPAAQPVKLPPAMSEPDIADADIEALLADNSLEMPNSDPDIRNIARQTAAPQQPAPARAARQHNYELKVMRRIVQKYSGTLTTETQNGFFAIKIIFPLKQGE